MAAHGMFSKAIAGTARAYARQDCVVSTRRDYRPSESAPAAASQTRSLATNCPTTIHKLAHFRLPWPGMTSRPKRPRLKINHGPRQLQLSPRAL